METWRRVAGTFQVCRRGGMEVWCAKERSRCVDVQVWSSIGLEVWRRVAGVAMWRYERALQACRRGNGGVEARRLKARCRRIGMEAWRCDVGM